MPTVKSSNRLGIVIGITVLLGAALAGCSMTKAAELSGQEILNSGLKSAAELESFHYQLSLSMVGGLPTALDPNTTELKLEASGDVAKRLSGQPQLGLTGRLQTVSAQGVSTMAGTMIGLADYTYFRITDLKLPQAGQLPFSGRSPWYKLKQTPAAADGQLGGSNQSSIISPSQLVQIQNLLSTVSLFEVVETLADETVANQRSYHYKVRIRPGAWDALVNELGDIVRLGQPAPSGTSIANQLADIWVSKREHSLTRIRSASGFTTATGQPVTFEFDLQFSKQNSNIIITAPNTAEELGSFDHWLL